MERNLLIEHFKKQGFKLLPKTVNFNQIALATDLLFERDSTIKAVVIRDSTDSLPETMIQRFSQSTRIHSKTLEIFFAFPNKPKFNILSNCKLFGVGILYKDIHNVVQIYAESKQIKGRKIIASIPRTQIFFSSLQHLDERKEGETIINDQRDSLRVPIFSMLVENDQQYSNDIRKLWPIICQCMGDCQYVLVILSGEYRKIIDRETRRALEYYDPDEILFYIKNDKQTKEEWKKLIELVILNNVKYTEYFDMRDFKLKFNQRLMKIIIKLHKDNGVQFLADGL
jgi:hypothetical protein